MTSYPPFSIRSDLLGAFNPGYIAKLKAAFGIDKEIDIVRLSASNKETLFSYIVHNCIKLLSKNDLQLLNERVKIEGIGDIVDHFFEIYNREPVKNRYADIFEFFSGTSL